MSGLALAAPPTAPGGEPVRVLLKDGRFVRALEMPEIRDGRAWVRLYPGGMLAALDPDTLDLAATEAEQRRRAAAREADGPQPRVRGTVSGGGESAPSPAIQTQPAPPPAPTWESPEEEARKERVARYAERFTELSIRQEDLLRLVGELHAQRRELERETRRQLLNPQLAGGLARKLRAVEAEIEIRQKELAATQDALLALLHQAAAEGLPVRRLPAATP